MSYHPIIIQHQDPDTEEWADKLRLHATQVNRAGGGETYNAGAEQYHPRMTFDLRWCKALEDVRWNPAAHRLVYRGHAFNITDYDDFMEQHLTVRLTGEAYG